MESCGFSCSRKTLITLNVLYIVVAFILIGVAGAGKGASIVTSIAVFGGIVACGIFLLILAIVGIYGAVRHHQVLLFFYMILLLIIFLMQFAIACGCLAINSDQQKTVVKAAWDLALDKEYKVINLAQSNFDCCRFDLANETIPDEVTCDAVGVVVASFPVYPLFFLSANLYLRRVLFL
ncbi:PREDICTED: tetraspanin-31-like [Priapulus caudatus]|uniref:Tetraspanin-31-like n=1 Tax=Priapulus caudatus TaxID=37621 RepID=A0ABM1EP55_PRICU|nr:PREDICTED: tetraspanin-31-like [Priapulus caudatus]